VNSSGYERSQRNATGSPPIGGWKTARRRAESEDEPGVDVGRNFGESRPPRRSTAGTVLRCGVHRPEDEVIDAIEDAADELGQSFETVRGNVAYIMDSPFEEEGVSTSFNESISGASLEHDEVGTGDPV